MWAAEFRERRGKKVGERMGGRRRREREKGERSGRSLVVKEGYHWKEERGG